MTNYTPDKKLLAPCMRALLRKQVASRMDIINYCNHFLHLELRKTNRTIYKGTCPWCGKKEVFFCHKEAGTCICESCETIADFFDIMTTHWKLDVSFALDLLALQLIKKAAESAQAPGQGGAA